MLFLSLSHTQKHTKTHSSLVIACNSLIHYYAKAKQVSGARIVLAFMSKHNLPLDDVSYNTLISAHAAVGDLSGAVDLFSEMKRAGVCEAMCRVYGEGVCVEGGGVCV